MPISNTTEGLQLRRAVRGDLEFFLKVESLNEGYQTSHTVNWNETQWTDQHRKLLGFLTETDKFAFVFEEVSSPCVIAGICGRFIDVGPTLPQWSVFHQLPRQLFPEDGRCCEMFQLWVDPAWRRRGLATRLKIEVEEEAIRRGVGAIYTHTEAANQHVIAMNHKLGYREIRRGPIWDDIVRVSLLKQLPGCRAKI